MLILHGKDFYLVVKVQSEISRPLTTLLWADCKQLLVMIASL